MRKFRLYRHAKIRNAIRRRIKYLKELDKREDALLILGKMILKNIQKRYKTPCLIGDKKIMVNCNKL